MVLAFVMVKVGGGEYMNWMTTVREEIAKMPEVLEAVNVFGRYDIIAKVKVETWKDLTSLVGDRIRAIPGVQSTETLVAYAE